MTTTVRNMLGRSTAERRAIQEAVAAADQEARENWDDPAWQRAMAVTVNQTISEGFLHENLLALLAEVRNVGEGDRITISEVRGLEVFWISNAGTIDQSTLQRQTWEMVEDRVGYHVSENEEKLRASFTETMDTLIRLAITQLDAELNMWLLRLYQAAIDPASPYYVAGAGLTLAALDEAIREVQDETMDDEPALIGRATMINQIFDLIQDSGLYLPETNEDLIRLGVIGRYKGCRIVRLRNYRDKNNISFFPANELYVAGRDAATVGFWGGLNTKEWIEQGGFFWHQMGWRKAGSALHHPERVRRIQDTSRPA